MSVAARLDRLGPGPDRPPAVARERALACPESFADTAAGAVAASWTKALVNTVRSITSGSVAVVVRASRQDGAHPLIPGLSELGWRGP
jgi:hypothetical protein